MGNLKEKAPRMKYLPGTMVDLQQKTNKEVAVKVLFFGAARDAVGRAYVDIILRGSPTASTALAQLLEKFPDLKRFGRSLLFAVNQEYALPERLVQNGDELAVFPPVSGGATVEKHNRDETATPNPG